MEKEQTKLLTKYQLKKDRVVKYPYYIVSTTYQTQDYHFIITADYSVETAILSIYPFTKDMSSKFITFNITLTDILPRNTIVSIYVNNLKIRQNTSTINILYGEFIIGYRQGHLIIVEYKERECKIRQRYNKSIRNQGFFSRATTAIFGNQDTYNTYFKVPIRYFSVNPLLPQFYYIWQVGNRIILQKELNQTKENKFFNMYENINLQNFYKNYDMKKVIKQGNLYLYGCQYYTVMQNAQLNIHLIQFKEDISSFIKSIQRKELIISLSSKQTILILDFNHFTLKNIITTEMPMRKLSSFNSNGINYLVLMPYHNYIVIYCLNNNKYCKLRGHKSFIANVSFNKNTNKIITSGMDHQICLMKISSISQNNWFDAEKISEKCLMIKEEEIIDQKFEDVFRLGEYNNNRSNMYSYGYADIFMINNYSCFPTFDARIMIYSL